LLSVSIRQVVTAPHGLAPRPPLSPVHFTVKFVIGAPLLAPAVQLTVAVFDRCVSAVTAVGASGLSSTVNWIVPRTCRDAVFVASWAV